MKSPVIKVCGMKNAANIREIADLKPDMMGFIFFAPSGRYVGNDFAVPDTGEIETVGVFVDETTDNMLEILKKYKLHTAQLHGSESPETCKTIGNAGFKVMKAFGLDKHFDWGRLAFYTEVTQCFVFDTKTTLHGGSGVKFNWEVLDNYKLDHPFLLSGGIKPGDLSILKQFHHPQCRGFDINSGFEIQPGLKDVLLVRDFITGIR